MVAFILMLLVMQIPAYGQAKSLSGWELVEWGMTREQVKNQYPYVKPESAGLEFVLNRPVGEDSNLRILFQFNPAGILTQVYMTPNPAGIFTFDALKTSLFEGYGPCTSKVQRDETESNGRLFYQCVWQLGHTVVSLEEDRVSSLNLINVRLIYKKTSKGNYQGKALFAGPIRLADYERLKPGMTYNMAVGVLEKPGTPASESEIAGIKTAMYSWKNSNGSNMNAMFQNDALIQKAQFGLK